MTSSEPDGPDRTAPSVGVVARVSPRADGGWIALLCLLPAIYFVALTAPPPLGVGLTFANDFPAHRIWYTQVDAYFLSRGYFPLWHPAFEMGSPYLAICWGTATFYPFRWLTYLPTYFGGPAAYITQYVQVAGHMALALAGVYLLVRRHARASPPAAALGASLVLLNQGFNNFIRFPHGVENFAWAPWMVLFALDLARPAAGPAGRLAPRFWSLVLATALSWLTGYGQFTYGAALITAAIAALAATNVRGLLASGAAGLLGTLIAVGAILPAAEWVRSHPLRQGADMSQIHTIGVTDYAAMLLHPFAVDVHYSAFALPPFLAIAILGVLVGWRKDSLRVSLGMLLVLAAFIDLARGEHSVSFAWAYQHLPFFGAFNSPSKLVWFAFVPLAWFAALAVDRLQAAPRAARAFAAIVILGAGVAWAIYDPARPPDAVGIWRPMVCGFIDAAASRVAVAALLPGAALLAGLFVLCRSAILRGAVLAASVVTFALGYAQFATFVSRDYDPHALRSGADAFPRGLLGPRIASGYLALTDVGVTSPNVDPAMWNLLLHGPPEFRGQGRLFPATRFLWRPADPADERLPTLRVERFGPNHGWFTVESDGAGELTYLSKHSPYWRANSPYRRDPNTHEFYTFDIAPARVSLRMEFIPIPHIAASCVTLLGLALAAAAACASVLRRRGAWLRAAATACVLAGLALVGLFLAGAFARHSLSGRDLYGVDNASLDPAARVGRWPPN